MPPTQGLFLESTWRLHPAVCAFTSEVFYDDRLEPQPDLAMQRLDTRVTPVAGPVLHAQPTEGADNESPAEADAVAKLASDIVDGSSTWTDRLGVVRPVTWDDVLIVAPYNAQVGAIRRRLPPEARVGTVDKFQGQEAPVSIYSMTTSSPELAPRGMDFLYSRHRLNVATSRARCVTIVVASPDLLRVQARTPEQMRLANAFCRFEELARPTQLTPCRRRPWRPGYARAVHVAPLDLPVSRLDRASAADGRFARGRRGSWQHRPYRRGHRCDDRGQRPLRLGPAQRRPGRSRRARSSTRSDALSRLMVVRGRRIGLATGYGIGVLGAVIATIAVITRSFPLLLFGTVMIGFGNSSNQLSRYTAADLYPTARRASAIGIVVWGATFGAVVGPNLVGPAGDLGVAIGLPPLAGAYLLPMLFVGSAAVLSLVMLRPDPYQLADRSEGDLSGDEGTATSLGKILAQPNVPIAMVSLVTVQVVMTLIMTMTPLHMTETGTRSRPSDSSSAPTRSGCSRCRRSRDA